MHIWPHLCGICSKTSLNKIERLISGHVYVIQTLYAMKIYIPTIYIRLVCHVMWSISSHNLLTYENNPAMNKKNSAPFVLQPASPLPLALCFLFPHAFYYAISHQNILRFNSYLFFASPLPHIFPAYKLT